MAQKSKNNHDLVSILKGFTKLTVAMAASGFMGYVLFYEVPKERRNYQFNQVKEYVDSTLNERCSPVFDSIDYRLNEKTQNE